MTTPSGLQIMLFLCGLGCIALSPAFLFGKDNAALTQYAAPALILVGFGFILLAGAAGE